MNTQSWSHTSNPTTANNKIKKSHAGSLYCSIYTHVRYANIGLVVTFHAISSMHLLFVVILSIFKILTYKLSLATHLELGEGFGLD